MQFSRHVSASCFSRHSVFAPLVSRTKFFVQRIRSPFSPVYLQVLILLAYSFTWTTYNCHPIQKRLQAQTRSFDHFLDSSNIYHGRHQAAIHGTNSYRKSQSSAGTATANDMEQRDKTDKRPAGIMEYTVRTSPDIHCHVCSRLKIMIFAHRDPSRVAQGYTTACIWRNRTSFFSGTQAIIAFLEQKWARERNYRLRKELFAFSDDRIAVQFWYEYQDAQDAMRWKRCYGLEDWTFDWQSGKMSKRMMSGNDVLIGPDGNGEGRWFVDGVDVEDVPIGDEHW